MPEDTWNIVKEFMLDWRETHKRKLIECLDIKFIKTYDELIKDVVKKSFWRYRSTQGIRCQYPKKCISWNYDKKTKCITSYWRIPWHSTNLSACTRLLSTCRCNRKLVQYGSATTLS